MPTGWEIIGTGYGGATWQGWTSTSSTTATYGGGGSGGGDVWGTWTSGSGAGGSGYVVTSTTWTTWVGDAVVRQEDEAEYATRVQHQQDEYAERLRRQEKAKQRAKATFKECLSKKQQHEFEQFNSVTVLGSDGRTYLVKTGGHASGNVEVIEEGRPILRLCAHPRDYVPGQSDPLPLHDQFLAQVLAIQHDAEAFCRTANVHWREHAPQQRQQPRDEFGRFTNAA